MKVTIKDVARACNLSPVTVSRVIAGNESVNPATRDYVIETMDRMGYPHKLHRNAAQQAVGDKADRMTVVILIDDIQDRACTEMTDRLCKKVEQMGLIPLVVCAGASGVWKKYLLKKQAETLGVIAVSALNRDASSFFDENCPNLPVVAVQRCPTWSVASSVSSDDYHSAMMAVDYFCRLGHRNIALVNIRQGTTGRHETYSGYAEALRKNNIELDERFVIEGIRGKDLDACLKITDYLRTQCPEVTAVICPNEELAWDVMAALEDRYAKMVPKDISILTFDICAYSVRKMTCVGAKLSELSDTAIDILMQNVRSADEDQDASLRAHNRIVLRPMMVEGYTTGPCAVKY